MAKNSGRDQTEDQECFAEQLFLSSGEPVGRSKLRKYTTEVSGPGKMACQLIARHSYIFLSVRSVSKAGEYRVKLKGKPKLQQAEFILIAQSVSWKKDVFRVVAYQSRHYNAVKVDHDWGTSSWSSSSSSSEEGLAHTLVPRGNRRQGKRTGSISVGVLTVDEERRKTQGNGERDVHGKALLVQHTPRSTLREPVPVPGRIPIKIVEVRTEERLPEVLHTRYTALLTPLREEGYPLDNSDMVEIFCIPLIEPEDEPWSTSLDDIIVQCSGPESLTVQLERRGEERQPFIICTAAPEGLYTFTVSREGQVQTNVVVKILAPHSERVSAGLPEKPLFSLNIPGLGKEDIHDLTVQFSGPSSLSAEVSPSGDKNSIGIQFFSFEQFGAFQVKVLCRGELVLSNTLSVEASDMKGKPLKRFSLQLPSGERVKRKKGIKVVISGPASLNAMVERTKGALFLVVYSVDATGRYTFDITRHGKQLKGCPATFLLERPEPVQGTEDYTDCEKHATLYILLCKNKSTLSPRTTKAGATAPHGQKFKHTASEENNEEWSTHGGRDDTEEPIFCILLREGKADKPILSTEGINVRVDGPGPVETLLVRGHKGKQPGKAPKDQGEEEQSVNLCVFPAPGKEVKFGTYTIAIDRRGEPVKDSPFTVQILTSTTTSGHDPPGDSSDSGQLSIENGPVISPIDFVLGEESMFACDASDEADSAAGTVVVCVEDPSGVMLEHRVVSNDDGTRSIVFQPLHYGEHRVTVQVRDNVPLEGSPFSVTVAEDGQSATVSKSHSILEFPLVSASGEPIRDMSGVDIQFTGPGVIDARLVSNTRGHYILWVRSVAVEGEYLISVLQDGKHVPDSPLTLTVSSREAALEANNNNKGGATTISNVEEGDEDPQYQKSKGHEIAATGRGSVYAAGQEGTESTRGGAGNEAGLGGDLLALIPLLDGEGEPLKADSLDGMHVKCWRKAGRERFVRCKANDDEAGVKASLAKGEEGDTVVLRVDRINRPWSSSTTTHKLQVQRGKRVLRPSPLFVCCPCDAEHQEKGPQQLNRDSSITTATAVLPPIDFNLRAVLPSGKPLIGPEDEVQVYVVGPEEDKVEFRLRRNEDNSWSIFFKPQYAGTHKVHVSLQGRPLRRSPFVLEVHPEIEDIASEAVGSPKENTRNERAVHPQDMKEREGTAPESDDTTSDDMSPVAKIPLRERDTGAPVTCATSVGVYYTGPGELNVCLRASSRRSYKRKRQTSTLSLCVLEATSPGDYIVGAQCNGKHLKGSPFTVTIDKKNKSKVRGTKTGHKLISFKIEARKYASGKRLPKNLASKHMDMTVIIVTPGKKTIEGELKLNDGSAQITFVAEQEGAHLVDVLCAGRALLGSPFRVEVDSSSHVKVRPSRSPAHPVGKDLSAEGARRTTRYNRQQPKKAPRKRET